MRESKLQGNTAVGYARPQWGSGDGGPDAVAGIGTCGSRPGPTAHGLRRVVRTMRRLVERPWFERKAVGWGLSPARWQGWAMTVGFGIVLGATLVMLLPRGLADPRLLVLVVAAAVLEILVLLAGAIATSVWLAPRKGGFRSVADVTRKRPQPGRSGRRQRPPVHPQVVGRPLLLDCWVR
jgi:hypothetical protein